MLSFNKLFKLNDTFLLNLMTFLTIYFFYAKDCFPFKTFYYFYKINYSGRKYCCLGRLSSETGWKYGGIIESLEEKRKAKSSLYYKAKKDALKIRAKAVKQVDA